MLRFAWSLARVLGAYLVLTGPDALWPPAVVPSGHSGRWPEDTHDIAGVPYLIFSPERAGVARDPDVDFRQRAMMTTIYERLEGARNVTGAKLLRASDVFNREPALFYTIHDGDVLAAEMILLPPTAPRYAQSTQLVVEEPYAPAGAAYPLAGAAHFVLLTAEYDAEEHAPPNGRDRLTKANYMYSKSRDVRVAYEGREYGSVLREAALREAAAAGKGLAWSLAASWALMEMIGDTMDPTKDRRFRDAPASMWSRSLLVDDAANDPQLDPSKMADARAQIAAAFPDDETPHMLMAFDLFHANMRFLHKVGLAGNILTRFPTLQSMGVAVYPRGGDPWLVIAIPRDDVRAAVARLADVGSVEPAVVPRGVTRPAGAPRWGRAAARALHARRGGPADELPNELLEATNWP
jgi:hypothetical protein